MSTCLPLRLISPFPTRVNITHATRFQSPIFRPTFFSGLPNSTNLLRSPLTLVKSGFLEPGHLPDPEKSEGLISELFGRAEGVIFVIADAAVSNTEAVNGGGVTKQNNDWFSGITSSMETVLKILKDGLSGLHVPYAYGFAIILLTLLVKAATFPLSKKQVESAMAMRSLQPQIKAIQQKYAGDQERIQLETARLYKLAGINPLAGCLPTLATIPVWIGLYRALSNVANEGLLTEGFFWIPSLAGPTTIASRQNGSGISWLFPFVDGHPPLGWPDTLAYLVLPVLLILSQYISIQIMQSTQADDPNMKSSQAITNFLPLMIGYFALSVPSGLSLYWLTNNILSTTQQVWLQKMGGAKNPIGKISNNFIKEEKQQILKPIIEAKPIIEETSSTGPLPPVKEEATPSTGPRPGERFNKLKEEEARRKRQREEENVKAEEAPSKSTGRSTKGEVKKEDNLAKGSNDGIVETVYVTSREPDNTCTSMEKHDEQQTNAGGDMNKDQCVEDKFRKEAVEVLNSNVDSSRKPLEGNEEKSL